jgi:hypothetical protein
VTGAQLVGAIRVAPAARVAPVTRFSAALVMATALAVASAVSVVAATPTPGPGGDPRSSGQGPGLVGDPAFAVLAVLGIGMATLLITLLYIRATDGRRS